MKAYISNPYLGLHFVNIP